MRSQRGPLVQSIPEEHALDLYRPRGRAPEVLADVRIPFPKFLQAPLLRSRQVLIVEAKSCGKVAVSNEKLKAWPTGYVCTLIAISTWKSPLPRRYHRQIHHYKLAFRPPHYPSKAQIQTAHACHTARRQYYNITCGSRWPYISVRLPVINCTDNQLTYRLLLDCLHSMTKIKTVLVR